MTAAPRAPRPRQAADDHQASHDSTGRAGSAQHHRGPEGAARRVVAEVLDRHAIRITLPDHLGIIRLPEPQRLAYYAGLTALAAFGVLDWPVAAVLGIGHLLAEDRHNRVLAEFGEALAAT